MTEVAGAFETTITRQVRLPYLLTLPGGYREDGERWPVILFLHGAGERGADLERVRIHGIPKVVAARPDLPFITVSPQCPENQWWPDFLEALIGLLDEVLSRYHADPDRVYLTGLSMGGYGSWHLASAYPERFAAVAPICGGALWAYGFPQRVCALRDVPVWAFHGGDDDVVPLTASQQLVDTLRECGGNVIFTVYPGVGHDSWTQTYDSPALYEWFLAQRRGG